MAQRRHTVLIDWIDGDVEDADEITVFAENENEAVFKAKSNWRVTIGAQWPQCRITRARAMLNSEVKRLA